MATTAAQAGTASKPKGKLEDQAAAAALYVTKSDVAAKKEQMYLDKNNRLSSAGAAASLKYANPQDLPSFPSHGLKKDDSAAGAAASLGWANQKPFEHWKPDPSSSASAAAVMAKDYKMKPLWQPEQSSSGAKAAVLAHKDTGKVEIWKPEASNWGNSAASQAFKKYPHGSTSPPVDYGYTALGKQGSLLAASGAMANRKRAESTPIPVLRETYPDERNASGNALKAAISVHKKRPSETNVGGSTPITNMAKEMYTSHPPVAPEVEELNRQNTLRASAVAMAKGMYAQQQKSIDAVNNAHSHSGANAAHKRRPSSASSEDPPPMYLGNVQEAARKLAQERLSKLDSDHHKNRDYREYYGHNKPQSRLSIRGRTRRRASSDGTYDEDREQSNKIRAQMSIFSTNLNQVDEKKRAKDREALIAVAQRNVTKSLHGMDERVFADTGKVAPSLLSEWELKAHAAAQAKSETRMQNYGKVDIGGGKFVNQSAVDLIAAKNVQPVLDEINEKAQIERERQATIKAEQLERERKAADVKQREKETKEINKKLKQQDKDEEKLRKAEEKAERDREKHLEKEKRKSAKSPTTVLATDKKTTTAADKDINSQVDDTEPTTAPKDSEPDPKTEFTRGEVEPEPGKTTSSPPARLFQPAPIRTSMEDQASMRMKDNADAANPDTVTPLSPGSPKEGNKVKTWLKAKLSKRHSKNPRSPTEKETKEKSPIEKEEKRKSFLGGAALTGASSRNGSSSSLGGQSSSMRDVALAGKEKGKEAEKEEDVNKGASSKRSSIVSSLSSVKSSHTKDDEFLEAQDNFDEDSIKPPEFPTERKSSPARDSKFKEVI